MHADASYSVPTLCRRQCCISCLRIGSGQLETNTHIHEAAPGERLHAPLGSMSCGTCFVGGGVPSVPCFVIYSRFQAPFYRHRQGISWPVFATNHATLVGNPYHGISEVSSTLLMEEGQASMYSYLEMRKRSLFKD